MLGYTPEEWLEGHLWPERLHPDDRERVLAADERFEAGGGPFSEEYRLLAKDGSVVWVREEAVLVRDEAGEPLYWQGIITDVTEHKEAEKALRESEARYRALVERTPVVTYTEVVVEGTSVSTYVSPQVENLLGYKPDQLNESPPFRQVSIHSGDRERVLALGERVNRTGEPFDVKYRMIRKGGDVIWVKDEAVLVSRDEDGTQHWQGVIHDITERKALEERLSRQALRDPLTQLANRVLFVDRVEHALARTERLGGKVAVLFLDLDDFKYVNDSLGHEAGDKLLVGVADRLRGCLRPEDTLARLGGDEFVALLEDIEGEPEVLRFAGRTEERLREPLVIDGREVFITVSIGLAFGSGTENRPEDLLRNSDLAMYRAKRSGKDRSVVFRSEMKERTSRRLDLVGDLRQALRRPQEEFRVHYQPQVSLETGEIVGTEALIRWNHPSRGLILPSEFVPLAEETGLIVPLGWWVLREACRQCREWRAQYSTNVPLSVSVNLSGPQFQTFGLTERIRDILAEAGLTPSGLVLEITESALMEDVPSTLAALR
jgi:diguanylate cyclase (GGDEF)-like protein/PAS domain S-box-containing protein